ncbi:hypothetical protein V3851_19965 [Paenibacillus sp. M1]|uniref:Uncharacterized protein n=1 Tax=Paenibacillus haidiansis TaxID=1574488 RepID=A0ABU7VWG1_9BACL
MNHFTKLASVSIIALLLLSACGSNEAAVSSNAGNGGQAAADAGTDTSTNTETSQASADDAAQGPGQGMDEGQMKMMRTFSSLLRMDEQEGLGITKVQAESMLPIVQEAVTANELTEESDASLTALLTEEQQAFLTEAAEQMPGGQGGDRPNRGEGGPGGAPEGGEGQAPEGGEVQPPDAAEAGERPEGAPEAGGPGGGFANMGDRLIELLQAKIDGTE